MSNKTRRIAAHIVETPNGVVEMGVVDISDGKVVKCTKLHGEQASTEWLGGTITLSCDNEEQIRAYHNGIPII